MRTVLRSLEEKGYRAHAVEDRTFLYRPAASRQVAAGRAVPRIVDWFCVVSVEDLLVGMVDSTALYRKETAAARRTYCQRKEREEAMAISPDRLHDL